MMKEIVKNKKGITLVSLVIAVTVILIITGVVLYNVKSNLKLEKLKKMQNDIGNLRDKVETYYMQYGDIPAVKEYEYTNFTHIQINGVISEAVDTGKFYVIKLDLLDNLTLNYGKDYEKIKNGEVTTQEGVNNLQDLYIINADSHNIFYVKGITIDNQTYYTDYTKDQVDTQSIGYIGKVDGSWEEDKKVNSPKLTSGMTPIMFSNPIDSEKGQTIELGEEGFDSSNWYNYEEKKWANVELEDGSMFVWIPRYAYKITYTDASDKSKGGTIDVKFLIGTSDQYYDEEGNIQTAKRATSKDEEVDTSKDYYVHPAFTDESSIGYANGGWDSELSGIWVAKFEAGYASGNNDAEVKESSVVYTQTTAYVSKVENGTSVDTTMSARNWLDGVYGETETKIKYPTYQGVTFSMNYININDMYNISKAMIEEGNPYGLTKKADSHLLKNSEWGAVAYLGRSKYGAGTEESTINNINLNNSTKSVYAVTGVTTNTINTGANTETIENINGTSGNTGTAKGVYTWNQKTGQNASTTRNIYGIYDMSGGTWERTAGYVANENSNLKTYGKNLSYNEDTLNKESTKYVTVYPHDTLKDNTGVSSTEQNLDNASLANCTKDTKIYGDAIRETSTSGTGSTSWIYDYSYFFGLYSPYSMRGGSCLSGSSAGTFAFNRTYGHSHFVNGFRATVIVP